MPVDGVASSVADEIASRFMPMWLTITSMVWAVGMAAGIIAAVWRNRWPDRLSMHHCGVGDPFPAFALGMLFNSGILLR